MRLTSLQQYILKDCYEKRGGVVGRAPWVKFYDNSKIKKLQKVKTITQCLERLINRGYLIGHGIRTPHKWFIKGVRITTLGVKAYEEWLARKQIKLPL